MCESVGKMKTSFNPQANILYNQNGISRQPYAINNAKNKDGDSFTPSFNGTENIEDPELKYVKEHGNPEQIKVVNEIHKIKSQLQTELTDRMAIYAEENKTKVKIPNCIMLIDEHNDISKDLIDWVGETVSKESNTNFIKIAGANNELSQRGLGQTLKNARNEFNQTGKRTLIYVEDFDKLITEGENSLRNIASLKDIMCRTATDFGSTIIFKTKDATKLVDETIQPHRVWAKIMVPTKRETLDLYNAFWKKSGVEHYMIPSESQTKTTVFKMEDFKTVQPENIEKEPEKVEKVEPEVKKTEEPKVKNKEISDINTPKSSEIKADISKKAETISEGVEKASKSSKSLKVVAILVAIGAAIAGAIYFMKNKNKHQGVKENANPTNITSEKE